MKWTDVRQLAETLYDLHPGTDPKTISFVDLHNKVIALPGFDDDHKRGGEKALEAIQMAWMEEAE